MAGSGKRVVTKVVIQMRDADDTQYEVVFDANSRMPGSIFLSAKDAAKAHGWFANTATPFQMLANKNDPQKRDPRLQPMAVTSDAEAADYLEFHDEECNWY